MSLTDPELPKAPNEVAAPTSVATVSLSDLPLLLTAEEVRELGADPELLDQAGSYYFYDYTTGKAVEKVLYRSSDLTTGHEQELG